MKTFSQKLPSLDQVKAEQARRSLARFVREAWPQVEPGTTLLWNWHIDAICEHLEAVSRGQIRNLLINIAPGLMKSLITSVFWPAWEWIHQPDKRAIYTSYAMDLGLRDALRCRDLICSDWYRQSFCPGWALAEDQNTKSYYKNTLGGERLSISVGSRASGFRGHLVVCDDPLNASEAYSKTARLSVIYWWDKVMSSRFNDLRNGAKVIIMQRLHEEDLAGHVLETGDYEQLCLPTKFEPERAKVTGIGWRDPREEDGELIFPAFFTEEVVRQAEKDLGADFAGQHQQRPAPAGGLIFERHWWRFWQPAGIQLAPVSVRGADDSVFQCTVETVPERFDEQAQSWDMSFKDRKTSDFVCGQVWGLLGANKYLLTMRKERLSMPQTLDAVREMALAWPEAGSIFVEDKANGPAVIAMLHDEIAGLIPIEPHGGKEVRAHAAAPQVRAGNVLLPHPQIAPWVNNFIENAATFPAVAHDDDIDAMTQLLNEWALERRQQPTQPGFVAAANKAALSYVPF